MISNAADRKLFENSGTLPDVSGGILNYFQPMVFTVIAKIVDKSYQVLETPVLTDFQGVWQPFTAQQISMKPEGQREWQWFMLHAQPGVTLNPDDVVTYLGTQYRVKSKLDYTLYGYVQYELNNDYTGAGP